MNILSNRIEFDSVVIHESPGAPSSETPRINFEQFIQRLATIQASQGSHPPNPVPPTHHQTPPVVHQPSNPHAENNRSVLYGMIDECSF